MDSRYDFSHHEQQALKIWEKHDIGNPDSAIYQSKSTIKPTGKPFSIIMPPPNANDPLHIGHAMFVTIEDILIRFHRMLGDDTVWIPGTDHAGIETQYVFEKKLAKNKQSRFDFDRETLYQKIWNYVQENSNIAVSQIKRLGASADWSRYSFTLDDHIVERVLKTFQKLHNDGLVYRDVQLVNYCTKCGTSYSELEVQHQDQKTPLYYVKYHFADDPSQWISVATVRPEPIWADTHLAVNPEDQDKKHLIGKSVLNPLTGAPMPIIADAFVDPAFGTGIVKLTPAHDPNDFTVAKAHNLPIIQAISTRGKIMDTGGKYAGLSVVEARRQVVSDLQAKGDIVKIDESYQNRIGTCYRCGRAIEPLPLPQFFIRVRDKKHNLVKVVETALDTKKTVIHGAGREKILRNWLANLKDWNISRQIVWGIRIPVWYEIAGNESKITAHFVHEGNHVTDTLEELLKSYSLENIIKGLQNTIADADVPFCISATPPTDNKYLPETDTFDTWFSSAQWPVLTLHKTAGDFERFYPTSVMETAYDILLFWVMRMQLLGSYLTGEVPFQDVYLHGLVRDERGQKMSKSKGNVINPLTIVDEFGADALRLALVIRSTVGIDKSVGRGDFIAARNFTNKIWNAARFVLLRLESEPLDEIKNTHSAAFEKKLQKTVKTITKQLSDLKIGLAADTIYSAFWHWYCDECLEMVKQDALSASQALSGLITFLKLLHPFTPFVTEAIWQELLDKKLVSEPSIAASAWPA